MSTTSLDKYAGNDYKVEDVASFPELASAGYLVRPSRVFTTAEEKALYRKLDFRIMPILAVLYLLSFMVRQCPGLKRFRREADVATF